MEGHLSPWIRTKTGYVRLWLPHLANWSGHVSVTIPTDDPAESPIIHLWNGDLRAGVPLNCVIEESRDGVSWAASGEAAHVERQ